MSHTAIKPSLIGLLVVVTFGVPPLLAGQSSNSSSKPRVIILTDIGNEPDDSQSFIRLLVMANEFDIEGIVPSTGCWLPRKINRHMIDERLDAYEKVYDNLIQHDPEFPTADELRAITRNGRAEYGMRGVGKGKSTEASQLIIDVVDREDPRPVWVCAWGGAVDLAQALWDIQHSRTPEEIQAFVEKIRVYDIAGQDDCGAWAMHKFPDLIWLRSVHQFKGMSPHIKQNQNKAARGGDQEHISTEWTRIHIQEVGPLGKLYPDTVFITEGDTPSFLYLIQNGLSDPEHWDYGNWGGRFTTERTANPDYMGGRSGVKDEGSQEPYSPFHMYTDAEDTVAVLGIDYRDNSYAPVFRWRTAYQHEFQARMQWSMNPNRDETNHPPVPKINGEPGNGILRIKHNTNKPLTLSATNSGDPDGDALNHHWLIYPEPGNGTAKLTRATGESTQLLNRSGTVHVILETTDDGHPPLTRYRRVIVE